MRLRFADDFRRYVDAAYAQRDYAAKASICFTFFDACYGALLLRYAAGAIIFTLMPYADIRRFRYADATLCRRQFSNIRHTRATIRHCSPYYALMLIITPPPLITTLDTMICCRLALCRYAMPRLMRAAADADAAEMLPLDAATTCAAAADSAVVDAIAASMLPPCCCCCLCRCRFLRRCRCCFADATLLLLRYMLAP